MGDDNGELLLELGQSLCIAEVEGARQRFLEALAGGTGLALDGAALERIDAAGVQTLVSLVATARRDGVTWSWRAASEDLRAAATLLGVAEPLGLERMEG